MQIPTAFRPATFPLVPVPIVSVRHPAWPLLITVCSTALAAFVHPAFYAVTLPALVALVVAVFTGPYVDANVRGVTLYGVGVPQRGIRPRFHYQVVEADREGRTSFDDAQLVIAFQFGGWLDRSRILRNDGCRHLPEAYRWVAVERRGSDDYRLVDNCGRRTNWAGMAEVTEWVGETRDVPDWRREIGKRSLTAT